MIVYVIHVGATAEKLWNALTNPKTLQENWGNIQFEWTQGSRVQEIDASGKVLWQGEVLRVGEPAVQANPALSPRRLAALLWRELLGSQARPSSRLVCPTRRRVRSSPSLNPINERGAAGAKSADIESPLAHRPGPSPHRTSRTQLLFRSTISARDQQ
jgi:hypothetical protein